MLQNLLWVVEFRYHEADMLFPSLITILTVVLNEKCATGLMNRFFQEVNHTILEVVRHLCSRQDANCYSFWLTIKRFYNSCNIHTAFLHC